jgi:3-isopropylmalate/(R)-2-methylmalate dehydratase small subunit
VLTDAELDQLFSRARAATDGYELTVDLRQRRIRDGQGFEAEFGIDDYRREMLLEGLDEIGKTLLQEPRIAAFERARAARGSGVAR